MNQQNNYILKSLILPFLFAFSSSNAMFGPLIKRTAQWQENKRKHETKLKEVRQLTTVTAVDHEISTIKNDIHKECFTELGYITKFPYNELENLFDKEKTLVKKALQKEKPYITQEHDDNIPLSMYKNLIFTIQEEKINPKNLKLKYKIKPNNKTLMADSRGASYSTKARIRIYNILSQCSKSCQLFTFYHELAHLLLCHGLIDLFAKTASPGKPNMTKLLSIEEREADIHAASKNAQIAYSGMEQRCTFGHTLILDSQSHCHQMQIMYELMKQKEKLS